MDQSEFITRKEFEETCQQFNNKIAELKKYVLIAIITNLPDLIKILLSL